MDNAYTNNTNTNTLIAYARSIIRTYGVSYYFATWFFNKELREAIWLLYVFFRIPDEMVDTAPEDEREKLLIPWCKEWERVYDGGTTEDLALQAGYQVHHRYGIPFEYSKSFCDAMTLDLTKKRYKTYEELCGYMYGSAGVVGRMLTYVMKGPHEALPYAEKLGYAMQLTNFLRDCKEDYELRDRIYIPEEDMKTFSVSEKTLRDGSVTNEWKACMQFQIARSRTLYREAYVGIMLLPKNVRFPILLASNLYEAILGRIERQGYDIWTRRARTTFLQKLLITLRTLWQLRKQQ